jgi:hypothetical protein
LKKAQKKSRLTSCDSILVKKNLYVTSGHYAKYKTIAFNQLTPAEGEEFY